MKRQIVMQEKISSFVHSNERWVAKLTCGHEVSGGDPFDYDTKIDCEECDALAQAQAKD